MIYWYKKEHLMSNKPQPPLRASVMPEARRLLAQQGAQLIDSGKVIAVAGEYQAPFLQQKNEFHNRLQLRKSERDLAKQVRELSNYTKNEFRERVETSTNRYANLQTWNSILVQPNQTVVHPKNKLDEQIYSNVPPDAHLVRDIHRLVSVSPESVPLIAAKTARYIAHPHYSN